MDTLVIYDSVITTTAQHAGDMLADRDFGHRSVMQLWGQHGPQPRATLGVLWTVTSADLVTGTGTVRVRSNTPPERAPTWQNAATTTELDTLPTTGDHVECRVELAAQKSPSVPMPEELRRELKAGADGTAQPPGKGRCWRPNRVSVPDDELHSWARDKLARNGLNANQLSIVGRHTVRLAKRHASYPAITLHAYGTITDPHAWCHATTHGIGKGKAFGTGLLQTTTSAQ